MSVGSVLTKLAREYRVLSAYKRIKKLKKDYSEYIIFVAVQGLGDICYHFAFLKAIKERKNKNVLVIASPYSKELLSFYPDLDKIIFLNEKEVRGFKELILSRYKFVTFNNGDYRCDVYDCCHWIYYPMRLMNLKNITFFDILKTVNYEIGDTIKLTYPSVPKCDLSKFGEEDWKNVVVINPHSNFLNTDISIFEKIAKVLKNKGYAVYTNISSVYSTPLPNTLPLSCNLQELYYITKYTRLFVSVRTGLLDFSISNGGRYLVIYDYDGLDLFKKAYCLNDWETSSDVVEYDSNQIHEIMTFIESM